MLELNDSHHSDVSHTSAVHCVIISFITSVFCGAHNVDHFIFLQSRKRENKSTVCLLLTFTKQWSINVNRYLQFCVSESNIFRKILNMIWFFFVNSFTCHHFKFYWCFWLLLLCKLFEYSTWYSCSSSFRRLVLCEWICLQICFYYFVL